MVSLKQNKKNIFNGIFLILVFVLTFYGLFKNQEIPQVVASLSMAKTSYLWVGIVMVVIFVCSESVILHYLLRKLDTKVSFTSCIKYSFIGFFVSCITPSAGGGQPAQIYYMKKDNIDLPISTLIMMIVTVGYKMVLVVIGVFLLCFQQNLLEKYMTPVTNFFLYLGMVLTVIGIGSLLIFIFQPKLARWLVELGQTILLRLHIIKSKKQWVSESMEQYHEAALFFHSNWKVFLNVFYLSVFQRVTLFYVTYLVYRSFGLHGTSAYEIVILQAVISLSVDMLPLPGGMGASENLYMELFLPIFGTQFLFPSMLLSRGISYYALMFISAMVTCYAHIRVMRREKTKGKENL